MRSDWTVPLREIAEVFDGPHATPKTTTAGPVFLGISSLNNGSIDLNQSAHVTEEDFIKWTRRVLPERGDVVFSYETRLGKAAIIPDGLRCCLGRRMGLLRPIRDKVIPEFLLCAYLSPVFQETIRARTIHGSTVDRISIKELPDFPIQVPPMAVQELVVEQIHTIREKIDLNRKINQTL